MNKDFIIRRINYIEPAKTIALFKHKI